MDILRWRSFSLLQTSTLRYNKSCPNVPIASPMAGTPSDQPMHRSHPYSHNLCTELLRSDLKILINEEKSQGEWAETPIRCLSLGGIPAQSGLPSLLRLFGQSQENSGAKRNVSNLQTLPKEL